MSSTTTLLKKVAPEKARAAAVAETSKPNTLVSLLRSPKVQAQMAMALPKSLTADRLTRIIITECRKTPELLNCSQESFLGSVLQCAQLGLEPGSALGHCYLLPYGKNCQLIIGYRGMIDLARRSGQIASINAYCVYEADEFEYELGLHPDIKHKPSPLADRGAITYVYAVAVLIGGGVQFEVMSRAEIEAVRKQSKASKNGPWVTHWSEMARKTVVRKLFKYLPVSIEAVRAVEIDERSDRGEALTENDFIDAAFTDKGVEIQPITPPVESRPAQPAPAQAPKAPTPEPAPEIPDDIPPELDEWRNAYDQGQHV
jgi:recombination protein RecT